METLYRNLVLIGKSKGYPIGQADNDIDVIYAYENDLSSIELAEENGGIEYYILVFIKTKIKEHPIIETISKDWEKISGTRLSEIQLITEDTMRINKSFRYMFDEWHLETIRFKLPVVGFIADSRMGRNEAKKMLLKSAIKRKWEFWK